MKFNRKKVSVAVGQALRVGVVMTLAAPTAYGQLAPTPEAPQGQTFRLEVTGTRIKSPGLTSYSPISSYSAAEMEYQQPITVEQFFKELPQAQPSLGAGVNNGTPGYSTIDLRGLGPNRTLVLIDGRRLTPADLFGNINADAIPLALLQRSDVLTGGATTVYGADAISGVVNFILKKDFRGFELTSSYGQSQSGDGDRTRTDVTWGAGFDGGRGNVAFSFGKTHTQPVVQGDRSYGFFQLDSNSGEPSGSGTTVPVRVGGLPGGTRQLDLTTGLLVPTYALFNFNPYNYYQTPLDRTQAVALGDYLLNNNFDLYGLFTYTKSNVDSHLAPTGSFLNNYNVNLGNPFLPAATRQQICTLKGFSAAQCADPLQEVTVTLGRRFVEFGPRDYNFDGSAWQYTVGSKGDIAWGWTYDAYFSQGEGTQSSVRANLGSYSKLQQSLLATNTTTCLNPANNCVPFNIFGPAGSITQSMIDFVNEAGIRNQLVRQNNGSVTAEGDFGAFKSPWSKLPITAAVGYDQRTVFASNKSDAAVQTQGELLGTGAPTPDRQGEYSLYELYAEAQIPIITDMPWFRRLTLEGGARWTRFTTSAHTSDNYDTWKFGGEWEPVDGYRFRAMKNRATRAPNVNELFAPQVTGLSNLATDPCQGNKINVGQANTPGTLSNLCLRTGVPLSTIGSLEAPSAGQINVLTGGNPALGPEIADTVTVGLVLQPPQIRGLTATVDYWSIKINQAITAPAPEDILNGCYSAALNPGLTFNTFCSLIGRNPLDGTFNGVQARGVVQPLSNIGYIKTTGWDFFVGYTTLLQDLKADPKWGRLDLSFALTYVTDYEFQLTPSSILRQCKGYYSVSCSQIQVQTGNGGPIFKTKFNQRGIWYLGDWTFQYNWRYLGPVDVEPLSNDPDNPWFPAFTHIQGFNYLDLSVQWNILKNTKLMFSLNNVFDKSPPIVGNTIGGTADNNGNTFPQYYDAIGRFWTVGIDVKF